MNWMEFEPLKKAGWLRHCFTTRRFMESCDPEKRGRRDMAQLLSKELCAPPQAVVWGEQVHGRGVAVVGHSRETYREIPAVDALICAETGVCLVAFGADCPLVYIADPAHRVIALIHSGRRGCEGRVVTAGINEMTRSFMTEPAECVAVISPSIGPCCYPVDLWASLDRELKDAGVGSVENQRSCTACHERLYYSYRRERGTHGRMLAGFMIVS
ncbi:MAG: polyphenol oxidase family protein [Candidatus Aureabacteria bacterium]|nr:polyphenol oxidase family protein [Candidatus Auribacterota bacterium]